MSQRLDRLHKDLETLAAGDREDELTGIAAPVVAATIEEAAALLDDGPLKTACVDVAPRLIASESPMRVVEALAVVGQLSAVIEMEARRQAQAQASTINRQRRSRR